MSTNVENHRPRRSLIGGFLQSVDRFHSRTALVVDGRPFTYAELYRVASRIASAIVCEEQDPSSLVSVMADRSLMAYAGVLGVLGAGRGYVPLNPNFPVERTRYMLTLSGCTVLVAGRESLGQLPELLQKLNRRITVILPDVSDPGTLPDSFPHHRFVTSADGETADLGLSPQTSPEDIAYLLFTSGSTGQPKGVPISQSNACSYLDHMLQHYDLCESDRVSQAFDLTFDLSVHDLFLCWARGACLFSLPGRDLLAPAAFIRKQQLTVWFSVPSVIGILAKLRLLPSGCFPYLRYSWFCGEPLPAAYAELWQQAAPNSVLENLYGPTETTIAIASYRWEVANSPKQCLHGIVPLGHVFPGQQFRIVDEERNTVRMENAGELCLSGSQVSCGYWKDSKKSEEQFIRLSGEGQKRWYRTGDLVKQDQSGCLHYLGRIDHQVKIRGFRVELQEIEAALRRACASEDVVAVAWPVNNGSAESIVAFASSPHDLDRNHALAYCREVLPDYMVPRKLYLLDKLPCNVNGKIDRSKLIQLLEEET